MHERIKRQAAAAKKLEADVLKLDAKLKEVGEKMQRQLKKYATMYAKNLVSTDKIGAGVK